MKAAISCREMWSFIAFSKYVDIFHIYTSLLDLSRFENIQQPTSNQTKFENNTSPRFKLWQ